MGFFFFLSEQVSSHMQVLAKRSSRDIAKQFKVGLRERQVGKEEIVIICVCSNYLDPPPCIGLRSSNLLDYSICPSHLSWMLQVKLRYREKNVFSKVAFIQNIGN